METPIPQDPNPRPVGLPALRAAGHYGVFLAGACAAGLLTGAFFESGCTHGCHPWDPGYFPFLIGTLVVLGALHGTLSRPPAWRLAAILIGPGVACFALATLLGQGSWEWDGFKGLGSLLTATAICWVAGFVLARLVRGSWNRVRARSGNFESLH